MSACSTPILWSKSSILQAVSAFFADQKTWPLHKQFHGTYGLPSPRSVYRFWPSIAKLIAEAKAAHLSGQPRVSAPLFFTSSPRYAIQLVGIDGAEIPVSPDFWEGMPLQREVSNAELQQLVRQRLWTWKQPLRGIVAHIEVVRLAVGNSIDSLSRMT